MTGIACVFFCFSLLRSEYTQLKPKFVINVSSQSAVVSTIHHFFTSILLKTPELSCCRENSILKIKQHIYEAASFSRNEKV